MKRLDELEDIAKATRSWAEDYAKENGFSCDLGEMCGIVSAELCRRLQKAKFKVVICENKEHCFLQVKINNIKYIVDLTASQFEDEDIIIRPWPSKIPTIYFFWKNILFTHKSAESLRKSQQKTNWPENQWALQY